MLTKGSVAGSFFVLSLCCVQCLDFFVLFCWLCGFLNKYQIPRKTGEIYIYISKEKIEYLSSISNNSLLCIL